MFMGLMMRDDFVSRRSIDHVIGVSVTQVHVTTYLMSAPDLGSDQEVRRICMSSMSEGGLRVAQL